MKKSTLLALISISAFSNIANASLISVGAYSFDDTATISSITNFGNLLSSNSSASAITDIDPASFLIGSSADPLFAGNGQLGFSRNIYNGSDADLVFYFLGAADEPDSRSFDITINETTKSYNANMSTFVDTDGITKRYQIDTGTGFADLLTATVNLDDFNIASNGFITSYFISDINNIDRIALSAGFYTSPTITPVPLPAPLLLLLSGLTGLGLFGRHKNKSV